MFPVTLMDDAAVKVFAKRFVVVTAFETNTLPVTLIVV